MKTGASQETSATEIAIPENMREFARQLIGLAQSHNLREISGEFKPPLCDPWTAPIAFSWRAGRHGEDGYDLTLTSTHTAYVTVRL